MALCRKNKVYPRAITLQVPQPQFFGTGLVAHHHHRRRRLSDLCGSARARREAPHNEKPPRTSALRQGCRNPDGAGAAFLDAVNTVASLPPAGRAVHSVAKTVAQRPELYCATVHLFYRSRGPRAACSAVAAASTIVASSTGCTA